MSAPSNVVWREERSPYQWIGMHMHHPGGIRCNSRKEAEEFMRDLCGKRGCVWVRATDPTPSRGDETRCRDTGREWHLNFGAVSTRVKGYAMAEEDALARHAPLTAPRSAQQGESEGL